MGPLRLSIPPFSGWQRCHFLAALVLLYLLTHLPVLTAIPFVKDEGVYSVMIEEQMAHPTIAGTFLGYEVAWKPPLFFWISALFVPFLRGLPIPIEAVYRFTPFLFGMLNTLLVFLIFEKIARAQREAFLVAALYTFIFLVPHVDSRVLTDTMCATFVYAAILAYMNAPSDRKLFLLGGLLTASAFWVKQFNAGLAPLVALAYIYESDRKSLRDPLFLLSLLALPLAWLLLDLGVSSLVPVGTLGDHVAENVFLKNMQPAQMAASAIFLFMLVTLWLPLSLLGFLRHHARSLAASAWLCASIFPLIGSAAISFYYYPIMPVFAYFSVQFLLHDGKGKRSEDGFFYAVLALLAISCFALGFWHHVSYYGEFANEKRAGEFLAGRDNVLIIGEYMPGVLSYKMLEELRAEGRWRDYGLIVLENLSAERYRPYLSDYRSALPNVVDGSFVGVYRIPATYRKDTGISSFDYVCIAGNPEVRPPGGSLAFNCSDIQVYEMR